MLIINLTLFLFILLCKQCNCNNNTTTIINNRFTYIQSILSNRPKVNNCSNNTYLVITEYQFGQFGNNLIELTNLLYLTTVLNATFILPEYMKKMLILHDLNKLHLFYCFIDNDSIQLSINSYGKTIIANKEYITKVIEIESVDSFFIYQIFNNIKYNITLPLLTNNTVKDLSKHFITVYLSLWLNPSELITIPSNWLIINKLLSLNYTAVHKRGLDGGCHKVITSSTSPIDYSSSEIPSNTTNFINSFYNYNQICNMPVQFVQSVQLLHHKSNQNIYLAFDGQGNINDYLELKKLHNVNNNSIDVIYLNDLDYTIYPHAKQAHIRRAIDLYLAIHSDLFILNPRSTFSLQIYIVRICLDLSSVPILSNKDIYCTNDHRIQLDHLDNKLWVSWISLKDACNELNQSII